MRVFRLFADIPKDSWVKALKWLGYSLVIGLVPIWLGLIVTSIFYSPSSALVFVDRAQLALYSTAFLSTGFYIVGQEFKHVHFPGRAWYLLVMIVLLIIAIAVASAATIEAVLNLIHASVNLRLIRLLSIGGFALSIGIVFVLQALNECQTAIDIRKESSKQENKLSDDYDQLK